MSHYQNKCVVCGSKDKLHIHHKDYSDSSLDNCVVLCPKCHLKLHANIKKNVLQNRKV